MLVSPSRLMTVQPGTRPLINFNLLSGSLDSRLSFTRASTALYYNSSGVLTQAGTNVPRFDYDPVTLAPRGLLIEEARTNLFTDSNDFSGNWAASGCALTSAAATGPDGAASASSMVSSGADPWIGRTVTVTAGTAYTASVWVKATGAAIGTECLWWAWFSGSATGTDTIDTFTVTAGWQRRSVTFTPTGSGGVAMRLDAPGTGQVGDTVHVFGAQVEAGAFATSYIPTGAATATRAVDVGPVLVSAFGFNAAEGTMFVACKPLGVGSGLQTAIYLDDNTANERMGIRASGASNAMLVVDGGATQVNTGIGTLVAGTRFRAALAYKLNDFAGCMNGGTVQTDTSGTIPTVTKLQIGTRTSGTEPLNGWYEQVAYYARRLDNATVRRITT